MKQVRFEVAGELLVELLNLPAGTEFVGVRQSRSGEVELTVTRWDLPEVADGEPVPIANPTFSRHDPVQFEGWNVA